MKAHVQDALLQFLETLLDDAERLTIAWYGGEPLLCLKIIENLAERIHRLCVERGIKTPGDSIVTNGYLLTRRTAERLKAAGVTRAQVTIDGQRDTHDARRQLAGGKPTFDRILANVSAACDIIDVQVRINVDRANSQSAVGALDALAETGLQGKVTPYFGHVKAFSEACGNIEGACLTDREFSELDFELTKQALVRGFDGLSYPRSVVGGRCIADHPLGYVVAPNGLLFKCWAEASLGPAYSVGSVFDNPPSPDQEANLKLFAGADALANEECRACGLLPICMGGCPHVMVRNPGKPDCANWRYTLGETLAIRYKFRNQFRSRSFKRAEEASTTGSTST
jgi:uncharacterized protein